MIRKYCFPRACLLMVLIALCLNAHAQQEQRDYVTAGVLGPVIFEGDAWESKDGALEGRGADRAIHAADSLGEGDFRITLRLSLETPVAHREDKEQVTLPSGSALRVAGQEAAAPSEEDPAAWPCFAFNGNRFYFDSAHDGRMIVEGPDLGKRKLLPLRSRDYFKPGALAEFQALRHGKELAFAINGTVVHMVKAPEGSVQQFGLRPGNSLVRLADFSASGSLKAADAKAPIQSVLWESGKGGYHSYRIPSLLALPGGVVLAFCEGRKRSLSDSGDIDLLMRRSRDGGVSWGEQRVVWDDGENTCGNPCAVFDSATGTVLLLMTHNPGNKDEAAINAGDGARTVWLTTSEDEGETWSAPVEITPQVKQPDWRWYATGPGVGIQLALGEHTGRLIIPCDHTSPDGYFSHVIYSDNHGSTWQIGGIAEAGTNECQVVERNDGTLLLNMRRFGKDLPRNRAIATSQDGGFSWGPLQAEEQLPEPQCQASLIRVEEAKQGAVNDLLLFSNPAGEKREGLTLRLSEDGGKTWARSSVLHPGPAAYSCLAMLKPGQAGCLYEAGKLAPYESIVLAKIGLDWLQ